MGAGGNAFIKLRTLAQDSLQSPEASDEKQSQAVNPVLPQLT